MNAQKHLILTLISLLAVCSATLGRVDKSTVNGNLVIKYMATTGETFRIETTQRVTGQPYQFKTTINGSWDQVDGENDLDKLLGTVEHTVIRTKQEDGMTRYMTKNVHYDALGNYVKTSYSVVILDNAGLLVNLIWGDTLSEILEVGIYHNRSNLRYGSVTVGLEPQ